MNNLSVISENVLNRVFEAIENPDSVDELVDYISDELPAGFSLIDLWNMKLYVRRVLGKEISKGSSRAVFQIDDARVLKLATNRAGVMQNKQESNSEIVKLGLGPKIYNHSSNYVCLVSEYVMPATNDDFLKCFGVDFTEFKKVIENLHDFGKVALPQIDTVNKMTRDLFIDDEYNRIFIDKLLKYAAMDRVAVADLVSIRNWGLTERYGKPRLVCLDMGFSTFIWDGYYKFRIG